MTRDITIRDTEQVANLFGEYDRNMKLIERELDVQIVTRGDNIRVAGKDNQVAVASALIESLLTAAARGGAVDEQNIRYLISLSEDGEALSEVPKALESGVVCVTAKGRPVRPKTIGQRKYVEAIASHTITLGVGPAGTGKTYLAVAAAVQSFREKAVSRIILTRPAIEAGEKLGFLPGDLQSKVDPYLRPLYDALHDMFGGESFNKHIERGSIEVAPLAYMRGRTLDDSYIILDEAQNTTREQMKMFLTRLGFGSKIIITGDVTQIDLPRDKISGLKDAVSVLRGVEDVAVCELTARDVVRHALVQRIVKAYEEHEKRVSRAAPKNRRYRV
ncbi:phosphate starvation protein PhoH [Clostridia bacterium]|nr:phosphate starvation protein PhoH [Clostridia bacterium]